MLKIKQLVLWSNYNKIRTIDFNTNGITVLIGDGKVGKTSIISIIDYCLASSGCDIPAGLIRNCCSWFGIVLLRDDIEILLARKSPGDINNVSNEMYLEILENGILPKKLKSNISRHEVRDYLNEQFKLTNLNINNNLYTQDYKPSFRDTIGLNFYPQSLLLSNVEYFYKQSQNVHGKNFKFMFPYMLGVSSMNDVLINQKIADIKRDIRNLETRKNKNRNTLENWEINIDEKLFHCIKLGLINKSEIPDQFFEKIELLKDAKDKLLKDEYKVTKNSLHNLNKKVIDTEKRLSQIYQNVYKNNERLKFLNKYREKIQDFQNENAKNSDIRKISSWLIKEEKLLENMNDNYGKNIFYQVLTTIENEEKNLKFYNDLRFSIDQEYLQCLDSIENNTNEISVIENTLEEYKKSNEEYKNNYDVLKNLYTFYGELENYIKVYEMLANATSIDSQIEELKLEKEKYESLLKAQNNNDIEDVVSYLNGTLETFLDTLNVEFKGKNVWFDYNNIELRFAASRAGSTLSSIGSGSNHAQYHIAMAMVLQIFIQNKVKNKCTFDFVVFDQPSEIYFPTTEDGKKYSSKNKTEYDKENDVESLHMLFSTIAKTQKSSCPNLQIIVLEHAGEDYWKDRSNNFYTDNIKVINWKNTDEKLIPENWKDE